MANDPSLAAYAHTFARYVQQGVALMLQRVQQTPGLLPDDLRSQALHTLSFAFPLPTAWPLTRDLLLAMAPKMEQAGHREDWMPYLERGLIQSQQYNDHRTAAHCRLQLGLLCRLLSQFDDAYQHFSTCVQLFDQVGDKRHLARSLNELAWLEHLRHHYISANEFVERALTLLDANDPECAMSYRVQGMIAIAYERWGEAEELHRQALMLFQQANDLRKVAWSMQNLAYALRGQKKFQDAIAYYQEAAAKLEQVGDNYHWVIVQSNLGLAYYYRGTSYLALTCYQNAELVAQSLHDRLQLARIYTNRGLALLSLNKYFEAQQAFYKSSLLYEELGDTNWQLNALDGLAIAYLSQQHFDQAYAVLEKAIAMLPQAINAPNYNYLVSSLQEHLHQAKQGQIQIL